MRRCLRGLRDPELFRECAEVLKIYQKWEDEGKIDLYYADESCFSLVPAIPYGWQRQTFRLPSAKSKNIKILGFLSRKNKLFTLEIQGAMDAEIFVQCVEAFA